MPRKDKKLASQTETSTVSRGNKKEDKYFRSGPNSLHAASEISSVLAPRVKQLQTGKLPVEEVYLSTHL